MKPFHWFLLVFLSMLWGTSFLFTKLALESFSPFSFAFLRISLAALLAAWWLKSRGRVDDTRRAMARLSAHGRFPQRSAV